MSSKKSIFLYSEEKYQKMREALSDKFKLEIVLRFQYCIEIRNVTYQVFVRRFRNDILIIRQLYGDHF